MRATDQRVCVVCQERDAIPQRTRCWRCKISPSSSPARQRLCDPTRDWAAWFADRTIETPSGCLLWQLSVNRNGYGRAVHRYANQSIAWGAHRLAWTAFQGVIPDGLTVHHLCFTQRLGSHPRDPAPVDARAEVGMSTAPTPMYAYRKENH